MRLDTLLREGLGLTGLPLPDLEITSILADSRRVTPGSLFVAIRGETKDGHDFIAEAVRAGAAAVVAERTVHDSGVPTIHVPDSRRALGLLAASWHDHPSHKIVLIGVTGTDGKTTTCHMLHSILRAAGLRAGLITTVHALLGDQSVDTGLHVTTPDAPEIQGLLAGIVQQGATHCVLEVTSHGLAQERVAGCEFDLAVLTNITHEHLDYHGSFGSYRSVKARLFAELGSGKPKPLRVEPLAVLNRDDASYDFVREKTRARCLSYGLSRKAEVLAREIEEERAGVRFVAAGPSFEVPIHLPILGGFNAPNALAALATAVAGLGVPPEVAARGLADMGPVPGRMERVEAGQEFMALVDFAHTPNSLKAALGTARRLAQGKVIALVGSAGLRDRTKRRRMAEIAVSLADETIFTAEDPRSESLEAILAELAQGAQDRGGVEGSTFWVLPDRPGAIRFAVSRAGRGDVVIACGKGHEQSMCFGDVEYPWDDRTAMRSAISERLGVSGPAMPRLPTSRM
jgi:UDP-N-acetylmuramoyl-L-alanyl-D-glutamate--2,6-diaminopimelate ligase